MSDESFLKEMKKKFGEGSVFYLRDKPIQDVDVIPTGSLALDLALGVGGIPRARTTQLYGSDGTGKTTLAFHIIAEAQKLGLKVFFVDAEQAMDLTYAKSIGVDVDSILYCQPSSMEEALGNMEIAIESQEFQLIVLDSVAALSPQKEQDDDLGSANVALRARGLQNFLNRQQYNIRDYNIALLMINQIRDKIGSYFGGVTSPGGHALQHHKSVDLAIRRVSDIKDSKDIIGQTVEINVKKNKVAVPYKSAQFDIIYGKGIDPYRDMVEVAKNLGVLTLKGSYYVFIDESLGQGKDNAAETIKNNETLYNEIRKECFDRIT